MTTLTGTDPVAIARTEVEWLTELHQGLKDGTRPWSDWRDDLLCPERHEVAIEETWDALQLAREDLARLTNEAPKGTTP